jgi:hypothetical protein
MTANRKCVTLSYAKLTFGQAKQSGDVQRMSDMFKLLLTLYLKRNRKITMLKTKVKELKKQLKTEVSQ